MSKPIIGFLVKLLVALSVVFGIHITTLYFLELPLFNNLIITSYIINGIIAIIIFITLFKLRIKYLDLLGFLFMGGSFLKFAVYFIFFLPHFKADGIVVRLESTSFLIPYITSLIIETFYLIKLLNNKL